MSVRDRQIDLSRKEEINCGVNGYSGAFFFVLIDKPMERLVRGRFFPEKINEKNVSQAGFAHSWNSYSRDKTHVPSQLSDD